MLGKPLLTRSCCRFIPCLRSKAIHLCNNRNTSRLNHNAASGEKTVVEKHLLDRIKLSGPLPFATYMQQCLSHPTHGYYMNPQNSVFGARGDFVTSPEISQMFGELVAIWLISQYLTAGKEHPLRIIELGPGKGTLMGDILRVVMQLVPKKTININLVETSISMRETQKALLDQICEKHPEIHLHWHDSINELSPSTSEYTILIAHEFFDALPIHILQKAENDVWHEVLVASTSDQEVESETTTHSNGALASTSTSTSTETFRYVLSPRPSPISTVLGFSSSRFKKLPVGSTLEVSPTSFKVARKVGELLASGTQVSESPSIGGSGLIIDYGGSQAFSNSLRAFQKHKIVDVFHEPGNTDLTANVDFEYLKESMADLVSTHGPIDQRTFLHRMGLLTRLEGLMKMATTPEQKEGYWSAAFRLVDKEGMGGQYQVLGITNKQSASAESKHETIRPWPFVADVEGYDDEVNMSE